MKRGWYKKLFALLLAGCILINNTITVAADIGTDVMDALSGSDAFTTIKYIFTQMGAVFTGSLDDVINNNQTLLSYVTNGLPVEKDDKGNINIKSEVINNIYNAVKDTATALDGYYLVTPVRTFEDFFFNLPTGFPVSALASFKGHIDTRNGFVVASLSPNYIYTPGSYMSRNVSGYACMDGNYVNFCDFDLKYIGYQHYLMNGSSLIPMNGERFTLEQFKTLYMGDGATKVFYSIPDLRKYLGGYNNVYFRSNYYKYNTNNDNRITFQGDKVLTQNWDTINNNMVTNIRNEIVGKDLNEEDRQTAIDRVLDEILGNLGDIGGGIDNVNNNLNSWLSRIHKLLGVVSNNLISSMRQFSDILDNIKKLGTELTAISGKLSNVFTQTGLIIDNIQKIPIAIKGYFDNLGKSLDAHFKDLIDAVGNMEGGGGGSSIWDLLMGLLGGAVGGLLSNVIKQFIDGVLSIDELAESITGILKDLDLKFEPLVTASKSKFPISLPWDFIAAVMLLKSEPQTPKFELPLDIDRFGVHETVVLDMSEFSALSKASRTFLSITFIMILILITNKFFGGDK